jgi:hypothetical protein
MLWYKFYKNRIQQRQRPVLGLISSSKFLGVDVKITTFWDFRGKKYKFRCYDTNFTKIEYNNASGRFLEEFQVPSFWGSMLRSQLSEIFGEKKPDVIVINQGDQMSLWKNRPKCSPAQLINNLYRGKPLPKIWATTVIFFEKTVPSKQFVQRA